MELLEERLNNITVVKPVGRIDSAVAKDFETGLMEIVDRNHTGIIIDFSQLAFISSAGLRVLLMAAKKLKGVGGKLALSTMKPEIREVFEVSGFAAMLPISNTTADALATMTH